MTRPTPEMTIERFTELLDCYGAAPEHWPFSERAAALALLRVSSEARQRHDEAAALDALLDRAAAPTMSADLLDRVVTATRDLPQRAADSDAAAAVDLRAAREARHSHRRRWRSVAAAASLAAAAGVALWLARPVATTPVAAVGAAADASAVAMLDAYDEPTDALLDRDELDLDDDVPAFGCSAGEWGCPELDAPTERSALDSQRRIAT